MTSTARHLHQSPPLAVQQTPSPFPNPPPYRGAIGRLTFKGPSPKLDISPDELAHKFATAAQPDALIVPDTNVLTKHLDPVIWTAFRTKRILLTACVFRELKPWLASPFQNKSIRDDVVSGIMSYIDRARIGAPDSAAPTAGGSIEVLTAERNDAYDSHGFRYYLDLLALRKIQGPVSRHILTKQLGREPTTDELAGLLQKQFGPRGLLLAQKGIAAAGSPNALTDENLVVIAALTAIMRGTEVFIVTRDTDVFEQHFKLMCLIKEHYRAMCAAELYAANPASLPFERVAVINDGVHVPEFTDEYVMRLVTTDKEFNPLPGTFHCVNIYCVLLGGDTTTLKVSWCTFCAETEMIDMLRIKAATGGLSTDKFGGQNCTIRTEPFAPDNHRVIVSIGNEPTRQFGPLGKYRLSDVTNVLFENERHTQVSYHGSAK